MFAIIGGLLVIKSFAATSYPMTITASPATVTTGGSTTLSWHVSGYSQESGMLCTLTDSYNSYSFNSFRSPGSTKVSNLQKTTTFSMHCEDHCGSSGCSDVSNGSVKVTVVAPTPAPTISLSANPSAVSYRGSSTLSWSTSNANSCSASGSWSGSKATNGSYSTGTLFSSSIYKLSCSGSGGSTSKSVSVYVGPAPSPSPTPTHTITTVPPPKSSNSGLISVAFISDLSVYAITDTSAHISWKTTSSVAAHLSYGVDSNNLDGSFDEHGSSIHHDIVLDNLLPDTPYFFIIKISTAKKVYKKDGSFTTNPSNTSGATNNQPAASTKAPKSGGGAIAIILILLVLTVIGIGIWLLMRRRRAEEELYGHAEAEEFFTNLSQTETAESQQQIPQQSIPPPFEEQYHPHELLPKTQPSLSANESSQAAANSDAPQDMFAEGRERLQREGLSISEQPIKQISQPPSVNPPKQNIEKITKQPPPQPPPIITEQPKPQNNTYELVIDHES